MTNFQPFQDEEASFDIDDLTIENRLDRIAIYGSLQITRDKIGLQRAREIREVINAALQILEKEDLPDHVPLAPTDLTDNPFN
jgi:hypothetical protein